MIKAWISAFRLRTLPLSFSVIIMGSALAWQSGVFQPNIFLWALLTTLFLQILSNLSNDYGDAVSGVDFAGRVGPERMVQSGAISPQQMKKAMWAFGLLSLASGVKLLMVAYANLHTSGFIFMLALGLASIAAAICYTVGKRPYGYMGLGDVFVFIFFGLVGVGGSYVLYAGSLDAIVLLPSASIGLLSVGVLNMNNMRDAQADAASGKNTLVVRMGLKWARVYHVVVVVAAVACLAVHIAMTDGSWLWLSMLPVSMLIANVATVLRERDNTRLDSQLKKVAIATFLIAILYAIGEITTWFV